MTNTENETYAKYLEPGQEFIYDCQTLTLADIAVKSNSHVALYCTNGEAFFVLGYTTVTLLPLTSSV